MSASSATTDDLHYSAEIKRKLLHLFALSMPIGYHLVDRSTAVIVVFGAFCLSLLVDLSRLRGWPVQCLWTRLTNPIIRPKEAFRFTGATYILLSGWLCPLFLDLPAAALGMVVIILGDTAAALVGRRWGRHQLIGNRSLEGSAAFLVASLAAGPLVPGVPWLAGLAAAPLATAVEALSRRVDDNLSVPLITGLFIHLVLHLG